MGVFFCGVGMLFILSIAALCLALCACVTDLRGLKIPNMIPATIMGLFCVYAVYIAFYGDVTALYSHLAAGLGMFIVTFIFFAVKMFGAGDAKLATALAFLIGTKGIVAFIFFMTLTGGVLAIFAMLLMKKGVPVSWQKGWLKHLAEGRADIPYAVAIFIGTVAGMTHGVTA